MPLLTHTRRFIMSNTLKKTANILWIIFMAIVGLLASGLFTTAESVTIPEVHTIIDVLACLLVGVITIMYTSYLMRYGDLLYKLTPLNLREFKVNQHWDGMYVSSAVTLTVSLILLSFITFGISLSFLDYSSYVICIPVLAILVIIRCSFTIVSDSICMAHLSAADRCLLFRKYGVWGSFYESVVIRI